jgi:type IV pilus assembly protein PilN
MSAPVLDLLRERRRSLGQEEITPVLVERRPLLRRGVLAGTAILGAMAGLIALLFLRHQVVKREMADLERYEAQVTLMKTQVAGRQAALSRLTASNRQLTEALTTVRTTSALLADLQLRTPTGVQLQKVEAKGPNLVLRGRAEDPKAFERINALQLELRRSPLLDAAGVTLIKVERQTAKENASPTPARRGPEPVGFEINGPFATLTAAEQLDLLRRLGSEGMASRFQLLRAEGLLP